MNRDSKVVYKTTTCVHFFKFLVRLLFKFGFYLRLACMQGSESDILDDWLTDSMTHRLFRWPNDWLEDWPTDSTTGRLLYSRKFSSAKNFVKSDHQAARQEFTFVKHRSLLICSPVVRSSLFCLQFIFTFMNGSDPTRLVCEKKNSQELKLVKKLLWRKRRN